MEDLGCRLTNKEVCNNGFGINVLFLLTLRPLPYIGRSLRELQQRLPVVILRGVERVVLEELEVVGGGVAGERGGDRGEHVDLVDAVAPENCVGVLSVFFMDKECYQEKAINHFFFAFCEVTVYGIGTPKEQTTSERLRKWVQGAVLNLIDFFPLLLSTVVNSY